MIQWIGRPQECAEADGRAIEEHKRLVGSVLLDLQVDLQAVAFGLSESRPWLSS